MEKIGHLIIGSVLGIILILITYSHNWFNIDLLNLGIIIIIIYVYSLLADIDTKSGTIVWTFFGIGIISLIIGYTTKDNPILLFGIILIALTFLAAGFFPHRGFTHSILFGVLVSLPWIYYSWHYSILAFICYYSHLVADQEYFKFI